MRKLICQLIVTLAAVLPSLSSAADLSAPTLLRKISLHVRGIPPSPSEYAELSAQTTEFGKNAYIRRKVDEYLKTPAHVERLAFRLSELFQLRTPDRPMDPKLVPDYLATNTARQEERDSLTDLFRSLAQNNLSWDRLLTSKSYTVYPDGGQLRTDDDFFAAIIPDLTAAPIPVSIQTPVGTYRALRVEFAENDQRIAGAVTTDRFMSRFNTTAINKNRRRAAALFRIFLCDPMVPAIPGALDRKHDFLDVAYANEFEATEEQIQATLSKNQEALHGADPQCMACHYKLDPMGRTFLGTGNVLHPEPFRGQLTYRRADGSTVNKSTVGLGELGKAITEQREYAECQTRWFWNQFIGQDVTLTPDRHAALVGQFDRVGRKTNDFIKALLLSSEFKRIPEPKTHVTIDDVRHLLSRCDTCHANESYIPKFSTLSLTGGVFTSSLIEKMKDRLARPDAARGKMPANRETWDPNDLALVRQWLDSGARDGSGKPMLGGQ